MDNEDIKNQIISEIQRIANELGKTTFSRSEFSQLSKISLHQVYSNFNGWNDAIIKAGLIPDETRNKKTDEELWQNLYEVCHKLDKIPNTRDMDRNSKICNKTYRKRFSDWQNTLIYFKQWLKENHGESKFINMIADKNTSCAQKTKVVNNEIETSNNTATVVWKSKKGVVYGAPIDYKGLRHEPVNEQGVVFLFGKINEELGIIVEVVRTGFPDCEGKRLIDKNKNLWEPVLIEFEYKSKNFLEHGHQIDGCDLIVCWEHNWEDCPLEVIELKEIINKASK